MHVHVPMCNKRKKIFSHMAQQELKFHFTLATNETQTRIFPKGAEWKQKRLCANNKSPNYLLLLQTFINKLLYIPKYRYEINILHKN